MGLQNIHIIVKRIDTIVCVRARFIMTINRYTGTHYENYNINIDRNVEILFEYLFMCIIFHFTLVVSTSWFTYQPQFKR